MSIGADIQLARDTEALRDFLRAMIQRVPVGTLEEAMSEAWTGKSNRLYNANVVALAKDLAEKILNRECP